MDNHLKRFYITTPIYYASGLPHLGHAYCTIFCDVLTRCKRLLGHEVFFSVGMDEHGQKIEKNAKNANLPVQIFVDNISNSFKEMWKILGIQYDVFIRTTEKKHISNVQKIFSKMLNNDDIFLGKYIGWYCIECETFWSDSQVGNDKKCPDCLRKVVRKEEESYFFKCSKYIEKLLDFYKKNSNFCFPVSYFNEINNNFIKPGLKDLSVSRVDGEWGIKVIENDKHYIYVWLDALFNYLSAVGFDDNSDVYKKFWENKDTEIIHVVGGDIARFHCVYWPMFLMACNYRLPNQVLVHGLIKIKNEKMSKSKKNVIDPLLLIKYFGADVVRYFLISEISFGYNYNFSPERFIERVNILPHQLGNLLNRSISMILRYFDGKIPVFNRSITSFDEVIEKKMFSTIEKYKKNIDNLKIQEAVSNVFDFVMDVNKYIDDTSPWNLHKKKNTKELESVMAHLAHFLFVIAILLSPVIVNKYKVILDQLGVCKELRKIDFIEKFGVLDNKIVKKSDILFDIKDSNEMTEFLYSFIS